MFKVKNNLFIALDYVWDKTKEDRTKKKAIFVDETWMLIGGSSNKYAAEFVLEVFKIIRGYGGAAIVLLSEMALLQPVSCCCSMI